MKHLKHNSSFKGLQSNSGFIIADFLFSFVLVIGVGIIIFALTFSLATIEVAQYIVWSTARNFAAGNVNEIEAQKQAKLKFTNLTSQFPLLTGNGAESPWFTIDGIQIGDLAKIDATFKEKVNGADLNNADPLQEKRQPWIGASANIKLKLFASIKIPFLGKIADDPDKFSFPIRAFIIRSPSVEECKNFFKYENRFSQGLKHADTFSEISAAKLVNPPTDEKTSYEYQGTETQGPEDNGC